MKIISLLVLVISFSISGFVQVQATSGTGAVELKEKKTMALCNCENNLQDDFLADMRYAMSYEGVSDLKTTCNYTNIFMGWIGRGANQSFRTKLIPSGATEAQIQSITKYNEGTGRMRKYIQCRNAVINNQIYSSVPGSDFVRVEEFRKTYSSRRDVFFNTKFQPFVLKGVKLGSIKAN